uniref:Uncharacterized protein n=1 Tax=Avena sativa TaxID=4498 RepID=A0ACD5ZIC3_AVESA
MADPGAEAAGGLTAPPPPPPPQKPDTAVGDATAPPPLQTDTADPGTLGSTPTPPPQNQTEAVVDTTGQTQLHEPPVQTEASGAAGPPAQQKTVVAGGETHLPAPPPPPREQGDAAAKDGNESKDSASGMEKPRQAEEQKPGPSRWRRVRSPVLLLLSLFRLRLGRQGQGQPIKQPVISPPPTEDGGAGDVDAPHKPATEKDAGEGSKRRRHEAEGSMSASGRKEAPPVVMEPHQTKRRKSLQRTESVLPPDGVVGSAADANPSPMRRKLQKVSRLVKNTMSWYRRHRSRENAENPEEEAASEKEKVAETKPSTSPPEEAATKSKQDDKMDKSSKQPSTAAQEGQSSPSKKPHPRWEWVEERLEGILEDACMRLVEAESEKRLDNKKRRCLLTFSVFPVGSEVKKQAVTYWWSTRFKLPSEKVADNANEIFSTLSVGGFLEPIENRCSRVIHGCRVNPLVHWMVKRMAREKYLADLDDRGSPAEDQSKSEVLCLTPGNRDKMQKLRDDDDSQARIKPSPTKVPPDGTAAARPPSQDQQKKAKLDAEKLETAILLIEYEKKKVILNISAHVYRLPQSLLIKLADQLEVLQLGRWGNSDDETYMEVEALESLSAIGKLKNLRYLSVRGLSRLTELPSEVRLLRRLAILDARGCQNLVSVPSATVQKLKGLTHLDLTECYMLEHIGRGVSALSELRVFKGFVFGVGKRRRDACRLQHLAKLKKLRKLNVNVTTDASVEKDEMAQLGKLAGLVSLTVTWGELPSVLLAGSKKLEELIKKWTDLVLPRGLEKLDVRCYPVGGELPVEKWLSGQRKLRKLYVRGGEVEGLDIPGDNNIETLRVRYLNNFKMKWTDELRPKLNMSSIRCVEVLDKDLKVMRNQTKSKGDSMIKDEPKKTKTVKEEHELVPIKKRMEIPESTIDENGVWVKDPKEEAARMTQEDAPKAEAAATSVAGKAEKDEDGKAPQTEAQGKQSSPKGNEGENEQAAVEDRGDAGETKKAEGGDIVKEEKDQSKAGKDEEHDITKKDAKEHVPTVDENGKQERDEKELKEDVEKRAPPKLAMDQAAADGDVKEGAVIDKTDAEKLSEVKEEREDRVGGAIGQDEPPTKEDKGDAGEIRKSDDGDADDGDAAADEPQGVGEGEVQEGDGKVFDMADEQPIADEDGGDGDTSVADVTSSLAPQPAEPKEKNPEKLTTPAKTTTGTVTPPALPPATSNTASAAAGQAATEPKEHDGSTGTGGT